jgi:hypothetical protein
MVVYRGSVYVLQFSFILCHLLGNNENNSITFLLLNADW